MASPRKYPRTARVNEVMLEVLNTNDVPADVELTLLGDGEVAEATRLSLKPGERRAQFYANLAGADRTLEATLAAAPGLDDLEREEPGFAQWKPFLSLSRDHLSYTELAEEFGMSEGAARVAVHRLRKRYRQRVRSEIAGSLEDASMVDEEMKVLFAALVDDFL